jgi:hypothetical protein
MLGILYNEPKRLIDNPFKGRKPKEISFLKSYIDDDDDDDEVIVPFTKPISIENTISTKMNERSAETVAEPQPSFIRPHYKMTHLQKLKMMFKRMLEASYKTPEEAEDIGKVYGLVFDNDLSNENTYVYYDMETRFPLITHRGSTTLLDWTVSDVLILTGLQHIVMPRVSIAREIVRKTEEKYRKASDGYGHSLGGFVAEQAGHKGFILTYNKAAGFGDIRKKIRNPKQIDYRNQLDIVSLLSETQETQIKYIENKQGILSSHSLDILPSMQERRV